MFHNFILNNTNRKTRKWDKLKVSVDDARVVARLVVVIKLSIDSVDTADEVITFSETCSVPANMIPLLIPLSMSIRTWSAASIAPKLSRFSRSKSTFSPLISSKLPTDSASTSIAPDEVMDPVLNTFPPLILIPVKPSFRINKTKGPKDL